jgi:tetratricopeptide (TPR) repeat protein
MRTVEEHKKRGFNFLCEGLFDQAIAEYTQVIQLKPDSADAYQNRGMAYSQKAEIRRLEGIDGSQIKEYDQAIDDFNNVLKLTPNDAGTYLFRGMLYAQKAETNKAIADFNEAIKLKPNDLLNYYSRGTAYRELRQNDLAKRDFEKVLDLNPEDKNISSIAKSMLQEIHKEEQEKNR